MENEYLFIDDIAFEAVVKDALNLTDKDDILLSDVDKIRKLYISPAQIGKEVFHNKLIDLIGSHKPCNSIEEVCPTCLLFGMAGENDAIASRIRFSDAKLSGGNLSLNDLYMNPCILDELASPKESATEFYLKSSNNDLWNYDYAGKWEKNKDGKDFIYDSNYTPEIQGRKFYWHQRNIKVINENQASKRNIKVRPLKKGVNFRFKIHFNRIFVSELLSLIWTLTIGNSNNNAHKIGMGKPLGLGSIKINVDKIMIRDVKINDRELDYNLEDYTNAFIKYIDSDEVSFLDGSGETLKFFKIITSTKNINNNIQYPENVGVNGKHYEWFSANKTNSFSPKIRQKFKELKDPILYKYKKEF